MCLRERTWPIAQQRHETKGVCRSTKFAIAQPSRLRNLEAVSCRSGKPERSGQFSGKVRSDYSTARKNRRLLAGIPISVHRRRRRRRRRERQQARSDNVASTWPGASELRQATMIMLSPPASARRNECYVRERHYSLRAACYETTSKECLRGSACSFPFCLALTSNSFPVSR